MSAVAVLSLYENACQAISAARSTDEAKDIRDKAVAMQAYARQAKNKSLEIDAAEIRFRAERRLGEMIGEQKETVGLNEGGRPTKTPAHEEGVISPTLADAGIDYKLSARAQAIAAVPEDEFEAELAQHRDEQTAVTRGTMERLAKRAHVANNSGENEWYTPPEIIAAARAVLGEIDLDPASHDAANAVVGAAAYFTKEIDGLAQEWRGRVFLNPPYAQPLIGQFIEKLTASEYVDQAIVLVNNGTETAWGQQLLKAASAVCFPRSRIRFIDKHGNPSGAPLQGQMIAYLGSGKKAFAREFKSIGVVLHA